MNEEKRNERKRKKKEEKEEKRKKGRKELYYKESHTYIEGIKIYYFKMES